MSLKFVVQGLLPTLSSTLLETGDFVTEVASQVRDEVVETLREEQEVCLSYFGY